MFIFSVIRNRMAGLRSRKSGLTLVELVVVVGLLVIVMSAVMVFFRPISGLFTVNERLVSYEQQSKVVLDLLEKKIRMTDYLAMYDYIEGVYPSQGPEDREYLFVENGVLYYASASVAKDAFVDPGIFDGNQLWLDFRVDGLLPLSSQRPDPVILTVELRIQSPQGTVLYEITSGFELVNMVLNRAELYDLTNVDESYPKLIVFRDWR